MDRHVDGGRASRKAPSLQSADGLSPVYGLPTGHAAWSFTQPAANRLRADSTVKVCMERQPSGISGEVLDAGTDKLCPLGRSPVTVHVVASYTVPVAARCMPASMRPALSRPRTMPSLRHLGLAGTPSTRLALRVAIRPLEGPRATLATRRLLALAVVDTALHQERDPDHAHEPVI